MQNTKTANRIKPLMPIEKLLLDKIDLEAKCREQEKKLNENFDYIRVNSSNLIVSGITALLFSFGGHAKNRPEEKALAVVSGKKQSRENTLLSFDNLWMVAKNLTPVIWSIVQPMIIRWGANKVKSMLFGSPSKKNHASIEK